MLLGLCHIQPVFAFSADVPAFFGIQPLGGVPVGSTQAERIVPLWWSTLARNERDNGLNPDRAPLSKPQLQQWRTLLAQYPKMAADQKLRTINGFFNFWPGKKDLDNYGQEEYWATPAEFFQHGGGDCEDYAIAKYAALRMLHWPTEDLWVVLVSDVQRKEDHAVLVVRLGKTLFVLDNLSRPKDLIMPHEIYTNHYIPRFAFNDHGVWVYPPERRLQSKK